MKEKTKGVYVCPHCKKESKQEMNMEHIEKIICVYIGLMFQQEASKIINHVLEKDKNRDNFKE